MPARKKRDPRIQDLTAVLEFYEAMGIERLAVTLPELKKPARTPAPKPQKRVVQVSASRPNPQPTPASGKKTALLGALREEIGECTRCKLSGGRKNIVFGVGNSDAKIMFIGEAPGREEDIQGFPFVGEAGTLLTKLIEKMGLWRSDVYIGNIVKCRPPENRDPEEDEIATCRQFIEKQIEIVAPEVIVTLGRIALQTLMNNPKLKITQARGHFYEFNGIPLMPTFHPAYLLRNPKDKWLTWSDAQKVMEKIGLTGE